MVKTDNQLQADTRKNHFYFVGFKTWLHIHWLLSIHIKSLSVSLMVCTFIANISIFYFSSHEIINMHTTLITVHFNKVPVVSYRFAKPIEIKQETSTPVWRPLLWYTEIKMVEKVSPSKSWRTWECIKAAPVATAATAYRLSKSVCLQSGPVGPSRQK